MIENGVQSCLQMSSMYQNKVIQARLLRAKARFAAGLRGAAHQGILLVAKLVMGRQSLLISPTVLVFG